MPYFIYVKHKPITEGKFVTIVTRN